MNNLDALNADESDSGDKSLVILQALLCLLREKNMLSRGDIEELCDRVKARVHEAETSPFRCCPESAVAAAKEMAKIGDFIGSHYGGKHRRM